MGSCLAVIGRREMKRRKRKKSIDTGGHEEDAM